jgi:hypothetical protein
MNILPTHPPEIDRFTYAQNKENGRSHQHWRPQSIEHQSPEH